MVRTALRLSSAQESGFTLLETLVVCLIISVLASASVVSISALTNNLFLKQDAQRLKLFLEKHYARALTRRAKSIIVISKNSVTAIDNPDMVVDTMRLSPKTTVVFGNKPSLSIILHPSITASPQTINLQRRFIECRVIVSLRGRFRVAC
jgi:prepilin-type N-terminal cleavage/methylation domain-containing protein